MSVRMKEKYENEVAPKVAEKFGVTNKLAMPKLQKIVLNVGMGKEIEGTKVKPHVRDQVLSDLAAITGQKAVLIQAKKAVSNFKVRDGWLTHAKVTLRGQRMWEFFDRLIALAIPRVRDFRGLSDTSFDKQGNYSIGVTEQGIFPEINMAEAQYTHGMNINFVFSNSDPEKTRFLLAELGVPFKRDED
ncbi:MAG: 50S ribosomal protein L5 [Phycisphaera sp.]|nr:50S ribosomal protein L5 [Phycisphaera sp.]